MTTSLTLNPPLRALATYTHAHRDIASMAAHSPAIAPRMGLSHLSLSLTHKTHTHTLLLSVVLRNMHTHRVGVPLCCVGSLSLLAFHITHTQL